MKAAELQKALEDHGIDDDVDSENLLVSAALIEWAVSY